jgi:hypothetical protein
MLIKILFNNKFYKDVILFLAVLITIFLPFNGLGIFLIFFIYSVVKRKILISHASLWRIYPWLICFYFALIPAILFFFNNNNNIEGFTYVLKILRIIITIILIYSLFNSIEFETLDKLANILISIIFISSLTVFIQVIYPDSQFHTGKFFNYSKVINDSELFEFNRGHGFSVSSDVASIILAMILFPISILWNDSSLSKKIYFLITILSCFIGTIFTARIGLILLIITAIFLFKKIRSLLIFSLITLFIIYHLFIYKYINIDDVLLLRSVERSFNLQRIYNEFQELLLAFISAIEINFSFFGYGDNLYQGRNQYSGDMQWSQLFTSIGLIGSIAIAFATFFSFNFSPYNNIQFVLSLFIFIASLKGPYILSWPIFDLYIIIFCYCKMKISYFKNNDNKK